MPAFCKRASSLALETHFMLKLYVDKEFRKNKKNLILVNSEFELPIPKLEVGVSPIVY